MNQHQKPISNLETAEILLALSTLIDKFDFTASSVELARVLDWIDERKECERDDKDENTGNTLAFLLALEKYFVNHV